MKLLTIFTASLFLFLLACDSTQQQQQTEEPATATQVSEESSSHNMLSESEKTDGWQLLFDGKTTSGWHSFKKDAAEGWMVENGELKTPGGKGDIVTDEEFENFELYLEWNVEPKGNSGIMFGVIESDEYGATFHTGPEYQIIDDEGYPSELKDNQKTASNYALHAPTTNASKPAGEYNTTRLIVNNNHVTHILNGTTVVEYDIRTPEWEEMVSKTKFKDMPGYGKFAKGKIALQDHSDPISFRNIKIKKL